jgi:nucleotide-binding universal stress UspA family protein
MYQHILVPTDGSEGTSEVVSHALEIARGRDATVHVLSVADRRVYLSADEARQDEILEQLRTQAQEAVDSAADEIAEADAGVDVVTEVREGIPHAEIQRYADDADIDIVTIGTHGRTGKEKLVHLGSVTDRVVKEASQPVLVVRIGSDDETATGSDDETATGSDDETATE